MSTPRLLGRAEELEIARGVLDLARGGLSGALVVRGEAGIGKTALLDDAVGQVDGLRVSRVSGIQSEMDLGYAALHLILVPFLAGLASLPPPQRVALGSAFGLEDGATPDRLLVGLATLTLLADAAVEQPLLLVIDDAQWLDQESADMLAFVARRLHADGIAMLFAVREPDEPAVNFNGLPELHLGGLPTEQALELLRSAVAEPVDDRVGRRLVAETRANPLALLELADELTLKQLTGRAFLPEPLPLGPRLEGVFLGRVRALPPATQTLVLLAAAESSGDAGLLWRAAALLGLESDAAAPAEAERLLVIGPEVAFRHPLIRSAVYHGSGPAERRRVHAALAAADERDSDRRAWHRAAAAPGPDEEVAKELERSARRASAGGGYAATAKLLARAAELTADEQRRPSRLLAAAGAALTSGGPAAAEALLAQAAPRLEAPLEQAHGLRLRAAIRFAQGEAGEPFSLLMKAAHALQAVDVRLARDTLFEALEVATWTSREATLEAARAVRAAPEVPDTEATALDRLLEAFAVRMLDGFVAAVPHHRRSFASLLAETDDLRGFNLGSLAAADLWDLDACRVVAGNWVDRARARGALSALPMALALLAVADFLSGRFSVARALVTEGMEISRATTGVYGTTGSGEEAALAWTGPEADARVAVAAHLREALARGQGTHGAVVPEFALTQLELGLGNYGAACASAKRVYAADFLGGASAWNVPDLVEAAQRAGDRDTAVAALERLAERAPASGTPTALGLLARSRALLADDAHADDFYGEAIEHLERSPALPDLARAHLVYGEWLRRRLRRREARDALRTAHDMFEAIGAEFFAERARTELLATGERARRRVPDTLNDLTSRELQIAQLAAAGATNREIGAKLFISASTVAYHLRHVFGKVSVTARVQLRDVLEDSVS